MNQKTSVELIHKFLRGKDNNILIYDEDAKKGVFSKRLFAIIRHVGRLNSYGKLKRIYIPREVENEFQPEANIKTILNRWLHYYSVFKRRGVEIISTIEMDNSTIGAEAEIHKDMSNAPEKTHYGIVEYENDTVLCGI